MGLDLTTSPKGEMPQPLEGYRVLDLSGPLGVYCGKLMADMGADVIKIEPPGGDPMRTFGPFVDYAGYPDHSLMWLHFNTNKRSVTLDIRTSEGAQLLRNLARRADVLLETYHPGFLDGRRLGYKDLRKCNPNLVYVSITPFGQTGPYKDYLGSDLVGFAMGGYMYVTGWSHTPPTRLWGSQAYHTSSNRAFIATLIALYHRLKARHGQHVDISMQEAVAATTEHVNTTYHYEGIPAVRCGFKHGGLFVATWRCKDGYASITTNTAKAWDDLRLWMAEDGMVGDLMDDKYNDLFILRGEHANHIESLIESWTMSHTRREITERGQAGHHPWGPVSTSEELLLNPQLWARGFFVEVEHPEIGVTLTYPGAPYVLSASPWKFRSAAPGVGQHNREIYQSELGLTLQELEGLSNLGVV